MSINPEAQQADPANLQDQGTQASDAETQANQENDQTQQPSDADQDRNWKAVRKAKEEAERRSQQLEKQNSELTSLVKEFISEKKKPTELEIEEDDSDIPTLGQTKAAIKREAEKIARTIVSQTLAEEKQTRAPSRLRSELADFDSVVSEENVDYLIKNNPELAAVLKETKDVYKQGKIAYGYIKALGLHKNDSVNAMKQDSAQNSAKPASPNAIAGRNSVGGANMFANGLTSDLKKQLHQEMIDAIKRR